jgi:hypothetical protein
LTFPFFPICKPGVLRLQFEAISSLGYSENVPLDQNQNVPIGLLVQRCPRTKSSRHNVKDKDIEQLAVEAFKASKKGITFMDVMKKFGISKKRAQRKLKNCYDNETFPSEESILFAPERHKPQLYYHNKRKIETVFHSYYFCICILFHIFHMEAEPACYRC